MCCALGHESSHVQCAPVVWLRVTAWILPLSLDGLDYPLPPLNPPYPLPHTPPTTPHMLSIHLPPL